MPQFLLTNAKLGRLHHAVVELRGVIDQRGITPPANIIDDRSNLVQQISVEGDVALSNALELLGQPFLMMTIDDFNHHSFASAVCSQEI